MRGLLTRIALPTPFAIGPVNVYLLRTDPLVLVDAGPRTPEALAALEQGLAGAGHRIEDVGVLLLTHQHVDHVGLASTIVERSGARVAGARGLAAYLADHELACGREECYGIALLGLHGVPRSGCESVEGAAALRRRYGGSVEVTHPLDDGDVLDLGAVRLRVHERPGHSPTDLVLVDLDTGEALAGDHLLAHVSSNPVCHPPASGILDPRRREPALVRYLDSVRATRELDATVLHAGHGEPVTDHRALIDARLAFHDRRLERIHHEVRAGAETAFAVASALWPGAVEGGELFLAISEALGHLDLLVAGGLLAADDVGQVVRYAPA